MFGADQIVAHFVGDYIFQSHWMATEKTKRSFAALCHAVAYTVPFFFLAGGWALIVIAASHFVIDRWRLARHVVWLKNCLNPGLRAGPLTATGYAEDVPPWMAVWLLIAADNTLHLLCNGLAIAYLGGR